MGVSVKGEGIDLVSSPAWPAAITYKRSAFSGRGNEVFLEVAHPKSGDDFTVRIHGPCFIEMMRQILSDPRERRMIKQSLETYDE